MKDGGRGRGRGRGRCKYCRILWFEIVLLWASIRLGAHKSRNVFFAGRGPRGGDSGGRGCKCLENSDVTKKLN